MIITNEFWFYVLLGFEVSAILGLVVLVAREMVEYYYDHFYSPSLTLEQRVERLEAEARKHRWNIL